jgi:hypothetical protein
LLTVAVKDCGFATCTVTAFGEIVTATGGGGGVIVSEVVWSTEVFAAAAPVIVTIGGFGGILGAV